MNSESYVKYLKYKNKYISLKSKNVNKIGGALDISIIEQNIPKYLVQLNVYLTNKTQHGKDSVVIYKNRCDFLKLIYFELLGLLNSTKEWLTTTKKTIEDLKTIIDLYLEKVQYKSYFFSLDDLLFNFTRINEIICTRMTSEGPTTVLFTVDDSNMAPQRPALDHSVCSKSDITYRKFQDILVEVDNLLNPGALYPLVKC
jgi:hypothetical protein